jgi:hypothetical protein
MKKTTLIMIASASMLFAAPAMDTNMNMQGKGIKMMQNCKYQSSSMGYKGMQGNKMMMNKKMSKKKMNSPFLIKHGLPHMSKMIMPYMNDPSFNLSADQKEKLTRVRVNTMSVIMETKQKVMALRKEIVNASTSGTKSADLEEKVAKLALLQGTATMAHLKCIEQTKEILTKDQLLFLLANKNKGMKHSMANKKGKMGKKCHSKRKKGQNRMMMNNCNCRKNNR